MDIGSILKLGKASMPSSGSSGFKKFESIFHHSNIELANEELRVHWD